MKTQLDFDTANFLQFSITRGNKVCEVVAEPEQIATSTVSH